MAKSADFDLNRLCEAIHHARRDLEKFRVERKDAVRQYVGGHWSAEGSDQKVPVNLISLYTQIVGRSLVPDNPRLVLSTFDRKNKPAVAAMETWANREVGKMGLAATLQRVVTDAIFSVGVCKVSLLDPQHSSLWGWNTPAGTAFAERVDLDDFVFDTHARDFREASFVGHRYRVPLDTVRDDKNYSAARKNLQESEDAPYNREGDERINTLQRQNRTSPEFTPMVDLWEIYLPRHNLVVTLPDDCILGAMDGADGVRYDQAALKETQWIGPDQGPYHFLAFGCVPGNAMPKSPVQDLIDLHTITNELYLKLMRQGDRQKEMLFVQGAADADGNRVISANDGEAIRVDNPDRMKLVSMGGPNQGNLQLAIHLKDVFSYMAGNLDALGGLSPQAKTLGQDRMLMESSSKTVQELQQTTIAFVSSVGTALCWFWWHDPFKVMRVAHRINGLPESEIVRTVYPRGARDQVGRPRLLARDAPWEELDLAVDPYSLQHQTPAGKLQAIMQVVQQVILPMQPILQQRGVAFDVAKLLELMSKYMNLPELVDIVTIQDPPAPAGEGPGEPEGPGKPAVTSREYTRHSAGPTAGTREAGLANMTSPEGGGGQGSIQ